MKRPVPTFLTVLAITLISFAACGTTPGEPATATLRLAPSSSSFTTATGWDVVLDEAVLVAGSAYFYAPSGDTMASLERSLRESLGVPVAHAHGGHDPFGSRPVRLEWLGPTSLDLLGADTIDIGAMDGSVGASVEVTLAFEPLSGALLEASSPAHGHHAWVAGTATRTVEGSTETIEFAGGFDFASGGTENLVEAIPAPAAVAADGTWTLHVALARWLDQARFERLPEGPNAARTITPSTQVGLAWDLGLRDPTDYELTYEARLAP
ncbi:MAG: hypothetical protein J0L92_33430 [Deltaproteobacteria bacterium]|nr:hypothetical protein [Deltaproteobacteria bacterium]